jgi:eukaryotic-like serine/threonine-protein kinase
VFGFVGSGGVGTVHSARDLQTGERVALKLLHPHLMSSLSIRERFRREARSAARLSHPNTVRVLDSGDWDGRMFLIMEYLEGGSLSRRLAQRFPLDPEEIVTIVAQTCDALAAAHDAGIYHRDLKPGNVMLVRAEDGGLCVKLVDFGMVKMTKLEAGDLELTPDGIAVGTPSYMSPEQCRSAVIDGRSDLYSLGIMLYKMLSNQLPFSGETHADVMLQHLFTKPTPPRVAVPDVDIPWALEDLALRAMAKKPQDRPADARAFRAELERSAQRMRSGRTRPGTEEPSVLSREARSAGAGIPDTWSLHSADVPRQAGAGETFILVVEPPRDVAEALSTVLLNAEHAVETIEELGPGGAVIGGRVAALVVIELGADPLASLQVLAGKLDQGAGTLMGTPVIVVGPEEPFEALSLSLELGLADYVATPDVEERLPEAVREHL